MMIKAHQQFELLGKRVIEKAVLEPPFRMIAEMPNEACFYYIIKGTTRIITPTSQFTQKANEGVVLKCGNYLNEYLSSENVDYCEAIAVHFHPDVIKLILDKDFPDFIENVREISPVRYEPIESTSLLKSYIDSLLFYFDNPELVSDELIKIKVKELILLLAKTDNAHAIKTLVAGMFTPMEVNFKSVVEANLYRNYSLEELSALSGLSLSSFKREFAKHYSTAPAKYFKEKKLGKAAKLLKNTEMRISDIAYECGFSDPGHFAKSFQQFHQCSPSSFRSSQ